MNIVNIVSRAAEVLGINAVFGGADGEAEMLAKCANAVIEELTLGAVLLRGSARVTAAGKRIAYAALGKKVRDVTAVHYASGERAQYVRYPDHIALDSDGAYDVRFCYYLADLAATEDFALPPEFSENVLCYGTLAEYYYRRGLIDEAVFYRNRFDRMAGVSATQRGARSVPKRRFLV